MSTKLFRFACGIAIVFVVPVHTQASLIGVTVNGVFDAPFDAPGDNLWDNFGGAGTDTPIPAVVGAGKEFSVFIGPEFFADFEATSLVVGIGPHEGPLFNPISFIFTDIDGPGAISNVVMSNSTFSGVMFSFGAHSIDINIPSQNLSGLTTATFEFEFGSTAVPEPASVTLLGSLAAFGMAVRAHRRRRGRLR